MKPGPIWIDSSPAEDVLIYANWDAELYPDDNIKAVTQITPKVDVAVATVPARNCAADSVAWPLQGYIAPWVAAAVGFALIAPAVMPDANLGGALLTGYTLGAATNYVVESSALEREKAALIASQIKAPAPSKPLQLTESVVG
jgi:predicted esterase YcpF (UPF0227 family)